MKYFGIKVLLVLSFVLSCNLQAKKAHDASVVRVYTHDCCGRGSYTTVQVEGGSMAGADECDANYKTWFAIETTHPNHDAFLSIALSALMSGKKVDVYGNRGGCIGPFNRADGIAIGKF